MIAIKLCFKYLTVIQICFVSLFAISVISSDIIEIFPNGGFEEPLNKSGNLKGYKIAKVNRESKALFDWFLSNEVHSGSNSLLFLKLNNEDGACINFETPVFKTEMNEYREFVLTWWVKRNASSKKLKLLPQFFDRNFSGGGRIKKYITYPYSDYYYGWIKEGVLIEMEPNSEIINSRWLIKGGRAKSTILIDDVDFIEVTNFNESYVERLLEPTTIPTQQKAPASIIVDKSENETKNIVFNNLLLNSSFELGLTSGWSLPGREPELQSESFTTIHSKFGGKSVQLIHDKNKKEIESKFIKISPNSLHILSCWAKSEKIGVKLCLSIKSGFTDYNGRTQKYEKTFNLSDKWKHYYFSANLDPSPNNSYYVSAAISGIPNGVAYIDGIKFFEGNNHLYSPKFDVESAIKTSRWPSNIYSWDEKIAVNINSVNYNNELTSRTLRLELVDFYGNISFQKDIKITIDNKSIKTTKVEIDKKLRGSFHLILKENNRCLSETTVTIVPPIDKTKNISESAFGTHEGYTSYAIKTAKKLGSKWTRHHDCTKITSWDIVEPTKGNWVWFDNEVDKMILDGKKILGVLGRVPPWQMFPEDLDRMPKGGWSRFKSMDEWKKYVFKVVSHYKGKIDHWEVWNEPYGFGINGDGELYVEICKSAYLAAKSANKNSKIIALSSDALSKKFNESFFINNGAEFCDILSFHHYSTTVDENSQKSPAFHAKRMNKYLKDYRIEDKPLWMTEGGSGYTSSWHITIPKNCIDNSYTQKMASLGEVDSSQAAICWSKYVPMMLSEGIIKIFNYWNVWKNPQIRASNPDGFTWFEYDGSLKPISSVYAVSAYFLDYSKPAGFFDIDDDIVARKFINEEKSIITIWSLIDKPKKIDIHKFGTFLNAFDMFGNPINSIDNQIVVGTEMLYIECEN